MVLYRIRNDLRGKPSNHFVQGKTVQYEVSRKMTTGEGNSMNQVIIKYPMLDYKESLSLNKTIYIVI